jgi:hypothetical protein
MKTIENISQKLERVMLEGFRLADSSTEIKFFKSEIRLYLIEGSIFIYFKHVKGVSGSTMVNLYEIGPQESYYLYNTMTEIIEEIAEFGKEADNETAIKVYRNVIEFCKEVGYKSVEFEEAIEKLK